MGLLSNRVLREELQPDDHVYSWRVAYSYAHHDMYIGDGKVIHFTRGQGQELGTGTVLDNLLSSLESTPSHAYTPCNQCGLNTDSNGVLLSCLDCFLCGFCFTALNKGEYRCFLGQSSRCSIFSSRFYYGRTVGTSCRECRHVLFDQVCFRFGQLHKDVTKVAMEDLTTRVLPAPVAPSGIEEGKRKEQ
ncbi:hypothetical protein L7F22_035509 [Adiantum nelumboides]|nr:hypothetical protein [Adiantum nelumboides]